MTAEQKLIEAAERLAEFMNIHPDPVLQNLDNESSATYREIINFSQAEIAKEWHNQWIPVSKRKPRQMQRCLVYHGDGINCYGTAIFNGKEFLFDATLLKGQLFNKTSDKPIFCTHWRPLSYPTEI